MKYPYAWTVLVLSTLTLGIACGDDDAPGNPGNAASGSAGRGGASGNGAAVGGAGGADRGVAGGADSGGVPGEGGLGGAVAAGSAGEGLGGVGGEGGGAAQPEHWLAFQLWTEDENAHPLFFTSVPPQADPVQVAPDVSFWQWAPDGTRLVYTTLAAYGGPPNAAFSVAVSAPGALSAPERLHEPLGEGVLALRVSISPDSKTLALQLYEETISTWYLRPLDGGVGDWTPVTTSAAGTELPATSEVRLIWSPDGARAAIIQREDATHDSLFIVDAVTGEGSQGSFGTLRPFQWSADGSRFFAEALGVGQRVLYAIDADAASNAVELAESAVNYGFDPSKFAVSSDGDTVAFSAAVSGVFGGVALLKPVASAQPAVQVGNSPLDFVWSERSEQFFFTGFQGAATNLYAVPRQGGDVVRVNPEGTSAVCNVAPCLRAAGDALLFMTSDADQRVIGNQLYDIDLSTPSPSARPLTAFAAKEVIDFLALSPNFSNVLLVATNPAGKHGIYLVDRSAAPPSVTRVFNPAAGAYSLSPLGWSPDSRFFDLQADPDKDGYVDLFAVAAGRDTASLPAPLTPQGRKITSVSAAWRPQHLP